MLVSMGLLFGVVGALGLLFTVMGAFFPGPEAHNDASTIGLMFTFLCLGPLALAVALLWIGDRALLLRLLFAPVGFARAVGRGILEPSRWWRRTVGSSLGRALLCALAVGAVVAAGGGRGARAGTAFLVLTAFSVADPILVAWRKASWIGGMALSALGWTALFLIGAATADGMGPDGMIFLFPMMVYPGAVAVSGIARLFAYARRKSAVLPLAVDGTGAPPA
jgi:hypothetical protein